MTVKKQRRGEYCDYQVTMDPLDFQSLIREIFQELFGSRVIDRSPRYHIQSTALRELQDGAEMFLGETWYIAKGISKTIDVKVEDLRIWKRMYIDLVMFHSLRRFVPTPNLKK